MITYNATFQAETYGDAERHLHESAAAAGLKIREITRVYVSPELLLAAGHHNDVMFHQFEFKAKVDAR